MAEQFDTETINAGQAGAAEHAARYDRTYSFGYSTSYGGGASLARYVWCAPRAFRVLGARVASTPQGGLLNQNTNVQLSVGGFASAPAQVAEWNGQDDGAFGNLSTGTSRSMRLLAHTTIEAGEVVQLTFGDGQVAIGEMGVTLWGAFI